MRYDCMCASTHMFCSCTESLFLCLLLSFFLSFFLSSFLSYFLPPSSLNAAHCSLCLSFSLSLPPPPPFLPPSLPSVHNQRQLTVYLQECNLLPELQSAYRRCHSTEADLLSAVRCLHRSRR